MSAGRFTIIEDYQINFAGGSCYLCKAQKRPNEPIIDCHIEVEGEGFLAICGSCASELGALVDLVPALERDEALQRLGDAERLIVELEDQLEQRKELESLLARSLEVVKA